jgi:putative DNA primase/helicase
MVNDCERAFEALNYLDAGSSHEEWVRIGMAAKSAGLSLDDFHNWSKNGGNYKCLKDCQSAWNSFKKSGEITAATLFYIARERGWNEKITLQTNLTNKKISLNTEPQLKIPQSEVKKTNVLEIWERCLPAEISHEYILRKQGKPDGLRYYPSSELPIIIAKKNVTDYLVVPCWSNGVLQTLQFIPPNGGDKLNLPCAYFNDGYFIVGDISDVIYIGEGVGQAWANNKASGCASVVCFGLGRMRAVANVLRTQYPKANLIIVSDRGKEKEAARIATEIDGAWIPMPIQFSDNYDVNDYLLNYGENSLRELLAHPVIEMPLKVIFADELPEEFAPPDELLQGVLIAGDGSILYGDSNSGKTFFVIDIACAVARGISWFGRNTEPGLVIYLAAESPASARRRLQAYQEHHGVRVPNYSAEPY